MNELTRTAKLAYGHSLAQSVVPEVPIEITSGPNGTDVLEVNVLAWRKVRQLRKRFYDLGVTMIPHPVTGIFSRRSLVGTMPTGQLICVNLLPSTTEGKNNKSK